MKLIVHLTVLFTVMSFPGKVVADDRPTAVMPQEHTAFFRESCLECHNAETQEGKVDLQTLSFNLNTLESAELWQKVLNAINLGRIGSRMQIVKLTSILSDSAMLESCNNFAVNARRTHFWIQ